MSVTPRVLVVGAGPVGLVAALLLARAEIPTVVVEAEPRHRGTGSRAICFQRDVLDILNRVGCAAELVEEGVTWWRGLTFYREHLLFETTFPAEHQSAYPPFINISQTSVERALRRRAAEEDAIELRFGCRVTAVRQDDEQVVAVCADPGGGVTEVAGDYLIACDGGHSAVRRSLGIPFDGESFAEQFLIADILCELPFPAERRFHFDPVWNPGRQVLVHPQPHSVWRIDWQVPTDFDLERERASGELDGRIRKITGDTSYEVVWASCYRFHQRVARTLRQGRVLLAGDAAHVMSPFGARGLNSGIQDAENAAWKLALVLRGVAGEALLDSYDLERRAAAVENLRVTGETMRFLVPQTEPDRRRRLELIERAVHDPAARTQVNSGKLAEPFWYVDSPLTTAATPDHFPVEAGRARPPVPGVLCPDEPCRVEGAPNVERLRHLFGDGFVALVDAPDASAAEEAARRSPAPLAVHRLADLGDPERHRAIAAALDSAGGTTVLVRPDGHIAARVDADDVAALTAAVRRACGGVER